MIPGLRFAWSQDGPPEGSQEAPSLPEETAEATPASPDEPVPVDPLFAINGYRVEGNTVLPAEKVDGIVSAHTGPDRRFGDVEAARAALEAAYREAGYPTVLVIVPEQEIEGGIVKLGVIESKLGRVEIAGNRYFMQRYILDRLPSLRPDALLYEPAVTAELNRLNANPDIEVAPVLSLGEIPGTVDLKLEVKDRLPLHAFLEWNNRGSPNTPRQRLSASVQYNNLFNRDHIVTFQTTQTPQEWGEITVYSLSYVVPLEKQGHTVAAYGALSDSRSVLDGSALPLFPGNINIVGNATVFGARYIFPLLQNERASDQLSIGIDYKRLGKNEADFPGAFGTALVSNRIHYAPLSAAYTGSRFDEEGTTRFSASVRGYVAGTAPGGDKEDFAGDPGDPLNRPGNRKGSSGSFAVLQAGIERSQSLPEGFLLSGKLDGQWASEPLISAEQYFAGGVNTVRGYLENEALGDDAVHWALELFTPSLPEVLPPAWKQNLRLAAFYDAASLWIRETPPGQKDRHGLAGFGFGIRLGLTDSVQARIDHAWAARDASVTKEKDSFTHFLVKVAF
ncbi:MAG: ShlB/FhaC/HecB family hemolysin secretion/activation protein [Candidatus Manganitrophaceae bacterium]